MKIEKLTEDKIRVIINSDEENLGNADLHTIMSTAVKSQGLFFNILQLAEKEVDFHTDGCKLLIEAFTFFDDILIFTITKYSMNASKKNVEEMRRRTPIVKCKQVDSLCKNMIYCFDGFDSFCEFCQYIKKFHNLSVDKITKFTSLYSLHNSYYLVLKNINVYYENIRSFFFALSEFGNVVRFSDCFERKLLEHGETVIKKNAISIGMKYF